VSIPKRFTLLFVAAATLTLSYLLVVAFLTRDTRALLSSVVEKRLPMAVDQAQRLSDKLAEFKKNVVDSAMAERSGSSGIDRLNVMKTSVEDLENRFTALAQLDGARTSEIVKMKTEFSKNAKSVSTHLQDLLSGLESKEAIIGPIQTHVEKISRVEADVSRLRSDLEKALQAAIESAARTSDYALYVSALLFLIALPFAAYYFRSITMMKILLLDVCHRLNGSGLSVTQISRSAHDSSSELESASTRQVNSLETIIGSTQGIRAVLAETSRTSMEALTSSETSYNEAQNGRQVIGNLERSTSEIELSYQELESLIDVVKQIHAKTEIINEIVFKTQLLSFNASIEAARAGNYGRGFAVVAEEVGKLAQVSGIASGEIATLLKSSLGTVTTTVERTKERIDTVRGMTGLALKFFDALILRAGEVNLKVGGIHKATSQQNSEIESIVGAIDGLGNDAVHIKNAARQVLGLSEHLRQQAQGLNQTVVSLDSLLREVREQDERDRAA